MHGHLGHDRAQGLLAGFLILPPDRTTPIANGKRVIAEREYYMILQVCNAFRGRQKLFFPRHTVLTKNNLFGAQKTFNKFQDWATLPADEQWFCHVHMTMKWVGYGFDDEARRKCWAPKRTFDGSNVGGSVPLAAILVNAKGWHNQTSLRERAHRLPLTSYLIRRNEHQRFRIVNGGVSQGLIVWCEGHTLTVVAADGAEVKPRQVCKRRLHKQESRATVSNLPPPSYRQKFVCK